MIHSVTVTNYLGESLLINLTKPEETGFAITHIDGISAGEAEVNTTEVSTTPGSIFNSSRATEREIGISIRLVPCVTIEESRHRTYKYFPLSKMVTLTFDTDLRRCSIDGYVKSNDADIFSETETVGITIVCPTPFFRSTDAERVLFYGIDPLFEFPFPYDLETSIESRIVTPSSGYDEFEFGEIKHYTTQQIDYDGDADTGVVINLHALGDVRQISIYKIATRETMVIDTSRMTWLTGGKLKAGDDLIVSTVQKSRYVRLVRDGETHNVLNMLDRNSSWFELTKGENVFAYTAEEGLEDLEFSMDYNVLYSGV